jgi:flagellar hook assembly protein FlgD
VSTGGAAGPGGELSAQKDSSAPQTDPKFGEVLQQMQAKYGAKAEKPREIKKTLGKDDFLRIMITQMKNQDPTNPFKAEQMATEMAQFTSVEQLQNLNQSMSKLTNQNKPLERMAMTNFIGKTVTVDRERFPHTESSPDSLSFTLPKDAASVKVAIVAETGETVYEKDLGAQKAGENSFTWDGKKTNTLLAKTGSYMLRVEAKDANGQSLNTTPKGQARVIGVSFEGSEPVFLIGDNRHQDKVTMQNIVRIEDGPGTPLTGPGGAAAPASPNFIGFQKGIGSSNLAPDAAGGDAAAALRKYIDAQAAARGGAQAAAGGGAQAAAGGGAQAAAPNAAQANLPPGVSDEERAAILQAKAAIAAAQAQELAQAQRQPQQAAPARAEGFPNGLHEDAAPSSQQNGKEVNKQ